VDENLITGDASDKEKFLAWAHTVPKTLKNPLYHWTHMELADPFGIRNRLLNGVTAGRIWDECNEMLQDEDFSARSLLRRNRVEVVATTDDPVSDLQHHQAFSGESDTPFRMVPTFRPDAGMNIEKGDAFIEWISKLEKVSGVEIRNLNNFWVALQQRHDAFHELGCRASDHGIEEPYSAPYSDQQVEKTFDKARSGKKLTRKESARFKSVFL